MASAWSVERTNDTGTVRGTVQYRHPITGEKITVGTFMKKVADNKVAELRVRLEDPDFINPKLGKQPFREYAEKWFAARGTMDSTKKVRSYLDSQLLPVFGNVPLNQIDRIMVQDWVESLLDPPETEDDDDAKPRRYKPSSIRSYYSTLSTIMKMAAVDRHIGVNPIGKGLVNLPADDRDTRVFLTLAQLDRFLEVAAAEVPYYYAMIKLTAETGMRWGEVAGLTEGCLDLDRGSVLIEQSLKLAKRRGVGWTIGRPKGGRSRKIGLDAETVEVLRDHLKARPARAVEVDDGIHRLVFTTPDGKALDRNNFRRDVWTPLLEAVEWLPDGMRFHDLRHTHISILLDLEVPVGDVADRAGHASSKMTLDRYRHRMPHADDRALDKLAAAKAKRRGGDDGGGRHLRVV